MVSAQNSLTVSPPSLSPAQVRFELITLGDELLLGLTANGHLTFIGAQLGRRGALLNRNVTITDEADAIAVQFRESWSRADVVITTGGLGPTCDDRTREVVAEVLGQRLVFNEGIKRAIEERFARFGRKMTDNNLKQAYVFERGEVLPNANGTAPGLWVEQDGKVLVMLPGPPNELNPMFIDQVVPRLAARGCLLARAAYVQLRTAGIGESALETKLQPIFERAGPSLSVAFCAHQGAVDCRVSSPSGALTGSDLERIAGECAESLGDDFVVFGHDSLAVVCIEQLRGQGKTLAVVEIATGGLLTHAFNEGDGADKFFVGGLVGGSADAKRALGGVSAGLIHQHGAVSEAVALAMATGAAATLGADYVLAVTGFADVVETGGTATGAAGKPVVSVFIALVSPAGAWSKPLSYPGPRSSVKVRAVNAALDWLRRELRRAPRAEVTPTPRIGAMS